MRGELVAIFEDDEAVLRDLRKTLERWGYVIAVVVNSWSDVDTGIEQIEEFLVTKVLVDGKLDPSQSDNRQGKTIVARIREVASKIGRNIRTIGISGSGDVDADVEIGKPYTSQALKNALE